MKKLKKSYNKAVQLQKKTIYAFKIEFVHFVSVYLSLRQKTVYK